MLIPLTAWSHGRLEKPGVIENCKNSVCGPVDPECKGAVEGLVSWARNSKEPGYSKALAVFWENGTVDVGRSALAQAYAEDVVRCGGLVASFFFSGGEGEVERLFPTIAYQMATMDENYGKALARSICADPLWDKMDTETQFQQLLVEPYLDLAEEPDGTLESTTRVIIIGGLEKSKDAWFQRQLIEAITSCALVHGRKVPLRWAFFSRPQSPMIEIFNFPHISPLCLITTLRPVTLSGDQVARVSEQPTSSGHDITASPTPVSQSTHSEERPVGTRPQSTIERVLAQSPLENQSSIELLTEPSVKSDPIMSNQEVSANNHHHSQEGLSAVIEPSSTLEGSNFGDQLMRAQIMPPESPRRNSSPPHNDEKQTTPMSKRRPDLRQRLQHQDTASDSGRPESSTLEGSNFEVQSMRTQITPPESPRRNSSDPGRPRSGILEWFSRSWQDLLQKFTTQLDAHYPPFEPFNFKEIENVVRIEKVEELTCNDIIVAVMGSTGAGKSTFIQTITERHYDNKEVGHSLRSATSEVSSLRITFKRQISGSQPNDQLAQRPSNMPLNHSSAQPEKHSSLVLVDTPGFDDTEKSDLEVLKTIAEWLKKVGAVKGSHGQNTPTRISGILYLHRITDVRISGTVLKNFDMFQKLCGTDFYRRVALVTTMWPDEPDRVTYSECRRREKELQENYWNVMITMGSRVYRFTKRAKSAERIIIPLREFLESFTCIELLTCGFLGLRIALVTTMWPDESDKVTESEFRRREKEIKENYWSAMITRGSRVYRFTKRAKSAERIINEIAGLEYGKRRDELRVEIQKEMVLQQKAIPSTRAGRHLHGLTEELVLRQNNLMTRLQTEMKHSTGLDQAVLDELLSEFIRLREERERSVRDMSDLKESWLGRLFVGAYRRGPHIIH
ncbi:hypothetical protein AN958_11134 [Leucoagaricus sp. SymC.cos]|nr:hypothetical protein AN958_11134 [Leucoagaricus sp. SymC.cos]